MADFGGKVVQWGALLRQNLSRKQVFDKLKYHPPLIQKNVAVVICERFLIKYFSFDIFHRELVFLTRIIITLNVICCSLTSLLFKIIIISVIMTFKFFFFCWFGRKISERVFLVKTNLIYYEQIPCVIYSM